jgi:hypothetical protein
VEKIKTFFCYIGIFFLGIFGGILLALLRRCYINGRGSTDNSDGTEDLSGGFESIEGKLSRAEEILRNAINRSKEGNKGKGESDKDN